MRFFTALLFVVALFATRGFGWQDSAAAKKKQASKKSAKSKSSASKTASKAAPKPAAQSSGTTSKTTHRRTSKTSKKTATTSYRRSSQQQPTTERYKEIQQALASKGYFNGPADGTWGPSSVDALKRFQRDQNLTEDGKVGSLSLIALGLGPKRVARAETPPAKPVPQP